MINVWKCRGGKKTRLIKNLLLSRSNSLEEPEYDVIQKKVVEILRLRATYLFNFATNKAAKLDVILDKNAKNKGIEDFITGISVRVITIKKQLIELEDRLKKATSRKDILGIITNIKALSIELRLIAKELSAGLKNSAKFSNSGHSVNRVTSTSVAAKARAVVSSFVLQNGIYNIALSSPMYIKIYGEWMVEVVTSGRQVYFRVRKVGDNIRTWHFKATTDNGEVIVAPPEEMGIWPSMGPGIGAMKELGQFL